METLEHLPDAERPADEWTFVAARPTRPSSSSGRRTALGKAALSCLAGLVVFDLQRKVRGRGHSAH